MKTLAQLILLGASIAAVSALADRSKLDTDGDGALSLSELQVKRPGLTEEQFALMDQNGDGVLTRDERPGRKHGRRMDTNGDGSIDLGEFQAVRPGMTAEKFAELDTNNDGLLSREERPRHRMRAEKFAALDTDGSGGVSLQEMEDAKSARIAEHFDRLDADGDGEVSV